MLLMNYLEYLQQVLRIRTSLMLTQKRVHQHNLIEPWSLKKEKITPIDFSKFEISLHQKVGFEIIDELGSTLVEYDLTMTQGSSTNSEQGL